MVDLSGGFASRKAPHPQQPSPYPRVLAVASTLLARRRARVHPMRTGRGSSLWTVLAVWSVTPATWTKPRHEAIAAAEATGESGPASRWMRSGAICRTSTALSSVAGPWRRTCSPRHGWPAGHGRSARPKRHRPPQCATYSSGSAIPRSTAGRFVRDGSW